MFVNEQVITSLKSTSVFVGNPKSRRRRGRKRGWRCVADKSKVNKKPLVGSGFTRTGSPNDKEQLEIPVFSPSIL